MPRDETIQEAGEKLSNSQVVGNWVKDGSPTAEPVTTETPSATEKEIATELEQPRDPATGQFLPKTAAVEPSATPSPAPSANTTAAPTPPAPGASAQEIAEFIEAQLADGTPFKLPKGVRIPLKRGETTVYDPIEDVQKRGMFEFDYRHKTAEVAAQRREAEATRTRVAALQARVEAREQWLQEREAEMREAQKDPEKWEAYQEMQRLYQANPQFRKVMDDALAKRETDAEIAVYQEREYQAQVQEGVSLAASWIDQFAKDPAFAGVNPERVRVRYAQALTAGQAQLDPAAVRALYADEARYLTESQGPLQNQLAELKAQVAALTAANGAERHNAGTAHALARAKTPPVAATGRPPAPAAPEKGEKFGPNQLAERNQAWANQR